MLLNMAILTVIRLQARSSPAMGISKTLRAKTKAGTILEVLPHNSYVVRVEEYSTILSSSDP